MVKKWCKPQIDIVVAIWFGVDIYCEYRVNVEDAVVVVGTILFAVYVWIADAE
jgi:hypothetical protein